MPYMLFAARPAESGSQAKPAANNPAKHSRSQRAPRKTSFSEALGTATREIDRGQKKPGINRPGNNVTVENANYALNKTDDLAKPSGLFNPADSTRKVERAKPADSTETAAMTGQVEMAKPADSTETAAMTGQVEMAKPADSTEAAAMTGQVQSRFGENPKTVDAVDVSNFSDNLMLAVLLLEKNLQGTLATGTETASGQGFADDGSGEGLLGQLMALLQGMGLIDGGTVQSIDQGVNNPVSGLLQDLSPQQNADIGAITGILTDFEGSSYGFNGQLSKRLQQLVLQLTKGGDLPSEMQGLEALIRSQLQDNPGLSAKDFLNRLAEAIAKLVEDSPQLTNMSKEGQAPIEGQMVNQSQLTVKSEAGEQGPRAVKGQPETEAQISPASPSGARETAGKQLESGNSGSDEQKTVNTKPTTGQGESVKNVADSNHSILGVRINSTEPQLVNIQNDARIQQGVVQTANTPEQPAHIPRMTQFIFGQIAQKAKLVISPGATEMHIQLKPDFLGKLNLSISSENGLVTAKFNAESYRVKEIIEANLGALKSNLAEQGIKVDQLIVNVGTQKDFSGFREREAAFYNHSDKGNRVGLGDKEFNKMFPAELEANAVRAYYGSSVDFTA
ncbi:MAG: flagellar hook-length control protein FliK [Eubacteriales bacterium]